MRGSFSHSFDGCTVGCTVGCGAGCGCWASAVTGRTITAAGIQGIKRTKTSGGR
jgi:hypothetical protein